MHSIPRPRAHLLRGAALLCLLAAVLPAAALDPNRHTSQYHIRNWTTLDGLGSDTISQVIELDDGRLLITSFYAPPLYFDGVAFAPVASFGKPYPARGAGRAWQAPDGRLWFVTTAPGLLRLNPDGAFQLISSLAVTALQLRRDGRLLLGTRQGLYTLNPLDAVPKPERIGAAERNVTALLEDSTGRLWLGADSGLYQVEGETTRPLRAAGLDGVLIWALYEDRRGRIWVGTRGHGLLVYDGNRWRRYDSNNGFPYDIVRWINQDRDGNLWAATAGVGLVRLHNQRIDRLGTSEGLAADTVWNFLLDSQGVLWVATAGGGLARVSDSAFVNWTAPQGLAGGFHWGIQRTRDGDLVLSSNNGLTRLRGERSEVIGPAGPGNAALAYTTLDLGPDDWLVGTEAGLYRYRNRRFAPHPADTLRRPIDLLYRDRSERIWVGGEAGLFLLAGEALTAQRSEVLGADVRVYRMGELDDGSLWLSTGKGLVLRRDGRDRLRVAVANPQETVRDVFVDRAGGTWLAGNGLWHYSGESVPRLVSGPPQGPSVQLHSLVADRNGALWAGSNVGVWRFRIDELMAYVHNGGEPPRARLFSRRDGLVASELNGGRQNSVLQDADGQIWYPSANGVTRLDPARLTDEPVPIHARIVALGDGQHSFPLRPTLQLPASSRRVTIDFTALPAAHGPRAQFRYRLQPGEGQWIEVGSRRQALLNGLGPGHWRFEVEAWLPERAELRSQAALEFGIAPNWWERLELRIAAIGTLLALLIGLPLMHIRALRRQRRALFAEVADKTAALERLARTDPLTGLANRRAFDEALEHAWTDPTQPALSLLLIDIDHFKAYNDSLGHPAGDRCLCEVAKLIADCARHPGDLAARIGGEEFAVLLPASDAAAALTVAERIRDGLRRARLPHPASSTGAQLTVSLGLASRHPGIDRAHGLLVRADQALYLAKKQGRDRIVVAAEQLPLAVPAA